MLPPRVLFLGEGDLSGAARYLAAVLVWGGFQYDHRPDGAKIPKAWRRGNRYRAVILSDYRQASFTPCAQEWLVQAVRQGTGLLMMGGWASFTGLIGGYKNTLVEAMLPVRCVSRDDRVNWASGSVLLKNRSHPILKGLSFNAPPVVCGYHRVVVKPNTHTLLDLRDLVFRVGVPRAGRPHPGLVVGTFQKARTAAFMTDCAPHWAGGLVDWGPRRVRVEVARENRVEIGDTYLQFFSRLIRWVGRLPLV